ncbi:MAG: ATP-binding cassette domain-containing protein [Armatimonadota bacterium]
MNDEIVVDVKCVEHVYPGGGRVDLCGIEFKVMRGQRVVVLGANGSGKSTLLKHVLGILKPTDGEVSVFGRDPAREYPEIRSRIGAVMQNVDEQLIGPTVFDDVAFSPLNFGFSPDETRERVESTLKKLGIYHLRDRLPHYLSGGERKKVALAGALVFGPELLVMDEPLEGVDYASRREISGLLELLHSETNMTMISTTHDMDVATDLADVGYVIAPGGRVELYGTLSELFFEHDTNSYNLAVPSIVKLIKELRSRGVDIKPTLDEGVFVQQLLDRLS